MREKIKIALTVVMIASVMGLGVIGCAKETAPTPAAPTAPTPVAPKTYTLKFANAQPPTHYWWAAAYDPFKKNVEERSAGRIKIEYYGSESLGKTPSNPELVATGVADIAYIVPQYTAEYFVVDQAWTLPGIAEVNAEQGTLISQGGIFDKYCKAAWEKQNLHPIGSYIAPEYWVFTKDKPLTKLEDFKGLTLRGSGERLKMYVSMGAIPVGLSAYETFEALQKGTVEAAEWTIGAIYTYKWYETGKPGYMTKILGGMLTGQMGFAMNKKLYESMPADLQKILDEEGLRLNLNIAIASDDQDRVAMEAMAKYGTKISIWPESEMARVRKFADELQAKWAADTDAKGLPGSEFVKAVKKAAEAYK